eukprot:626262-Amphidinium_carterae.1
MPVLSSPPCAHHSSSKYMMYIINYCKKCLGSSHCFHRDSHISGLELKRKELTQGSCVGTESLSVSECSSRRQQ